MRLCRVTVQNHALPAHALTDHQDEFFASLDLATVANFEKLFGKLNAGVVSGALVGGSGAGKPSARHPSSQNALTARVQAMPSTSPSADTTAGREVAPGWAAVVR